MIKTSQLLSNPRTNSQIFQDVKITLSWKTQKDLGSFSLFVLPCHCHSTVQIKRDIAFINNLNPSLSFFSILAAFLIATSSHGSANV